MNNRAFVFGGFLLFLIQFDLTAQNTLQGKVTAGNLPVPNANVMVRMLHEKPIIAFAIADTAGWYSIILPGKGDSLEVTVSSIGYATSKKIIINKSQEVDFVVTEATTELNEVVVKSYIPVFKKGDTISYQVDSFKSQADAVIADVIRKMPGFSVDGDGRVSYMGRPIQKYYIEGLDLLEGRYNLANNNLPADAVSRVQVLVNHQPIKLLDSLVYSDRASLNIKLKRNVASTGVASAGAGLTPALWNANVTPMLFTKKQQLIASYQTNNTGLDISRQLKTLTLDDLLNQSASSRNDWLQIQPLQTPPFLEQLWLNNISHLGTVNYLLQLPRNWTIKASGSFLHHDLQQRGTTQTLFLSPTDTISISEIKYNQLFTNSARGTAIVEKNTKKGYIKNEIEYNQQWSWQTGQVTGTNIAAQQLDNPQQMLKNKFSLLVPIGKKIVSFNSFFTYTNSPQKLTVSPGVFSTIFNGGNDYGTLQQQVNAKNIYTDNSFSLRHSGKDVSVETKGGFSYDNQSITSNIAVDGTDKVPDDFRNDMQLIKAAVYGGFDMQYRLGPVRMDFRLPVKQNFFTVTNHLLEAPRHTAQLVAEPYLSINKKFGDYWATNFSYRFTNRFGGVDKMYPGYILTSYRNLQQYNAPLSQVRTQSYQAYAAFTDAIHLFFLNASYSYSEGTNNLIFKTVLQAGGITTIEAMLQSNSFTSHTIAANVSKVFKLIKTNVTIEPTFILSNSNQIINNQLTLVTSQNLAIKGKTYSDIFSWLVLKYEGQISRYTNAVAEALYKPTLMQEHQVGLIFFLKENQYVQPELDYFENMGSFASQQASFVNMSYQYSVTKKKIDIGLQWRNIFNTKSYTNVTANSFYYIANTYELRPSQVIGSVRFRF